MVWADYVRIAQVWLASERENYVATVEIIKIQEFLTFAILALSFFSFPPAHNNCCLLWIIQAIIPHFHPFLLNFLLREKGMTL